MAACVRRKERGVEYLPPFLANSDGMSLPLSSSSSSSFLTILEKRATNDPSLFDGALTPSPIRPGLVFLCVSLAFPNTVMNDSLSPSFLFLPPSHPIVYRLEARQSQLHSDRQTRCMSSIDAVTFRYRTVCLRPFFRRWDKKTHERTNEGRKRRNLENHSQLVSLQVAIATRRALQDKGG